MSKNEASFTRLFVSGLQYKADIENITIFLIK
jgi:hypothetical protein